MTSLTYETLVLPAKRPPSLLLGYSCQHYLPSYVHQLDEPPSFHLLGAPLPLEFLGSDRVSVRQEEGLCACACCPATLDLSERVMVASSVKLTVSE